MGAFLLKKLKRIEKLAYDPMPHGCEKMEGYANCYRIRQGDYRIIYTIEGKQLIVWIHKIGHRREVYR
jgi:mRNA interferase RelE/StbE